jgi:hypothetical protein
MCINLNSADFDLCALAIARLGSDQADDVRASLAWVIRNRIEQLSLLGDQRPPVSHACDEVLHEALGALDIDVTPESLSQPDWCRIYALNCLVWSGDVADQTAGATACHRHDRNPAWARSRIATALLGSYIFFR